MDRTNETGAGATLHPQPQFRRERWLDLSGSWSFAFDDGDEGIDGGWQRSDATGAIAAAFTRVIQVPFPPESPASGIGDADYHPVVWYRRVFRLPADWRGQRILLRCGAVDYVARVWVNGQLVASHEGGHTPFGADITPWLTSDVSGEQVIVIRAEDQPQDLSQPRGKQDWQPEAHSIWYNRTTGIWQPVWLEPVSPLASLRSLRWTPYPDRLGVGLRAQVQRADARPLRLRVQLRLRETLLADDTYRVEGDEVQRTLTLNPPVALGDHLLWSPQEPNLIEATLRLEAEDGAQLDAVQSYFGLRSVSAEHGRLLLNGSPTFLRLVLEQGYWPQSHLAAPSEAARRREVELIKALGFDGARLHQKVEDPRFLYWCDRLGVVVWGEMAAAYRFTPQALERLTREWMEVIERDASHPCIVAWVPFNESWGTPDLLHDPAQRHAVQALYHLLKALDPTRPVIGNDGWETVAGDILGIHDYTSSGETLRARYGTPQAVERLLREEWPGNRALRILDDGGALDPSLREAPVMVTEFGGISNAHDLDERWGGYGVVNDQDAYLNRYRELVEALLASTALSGFCYTQLTDTMQERNGLLTEDRRPKFDPRLIHAINRGVALSSVDEGDAAQPGQPETPANEPDAKT